MARAPVPSVTYFRRIAFKSDAFKDIPDDVVLDTLSDATDHVASAIAKHAKGVISEWDRSFTRAILAIASLDLMTHRGFSKHAGVDEEIVKRAERAEAWLDKIASGEREPFFVDDSPSDADDGPDGGGSERSDAWVV